MDLKVNPHKSRGMPFSVDKFVTKHNAAADSLAFLREGMKDSEHGAIALTQFTHYVKSLEEIALSLAYKKLDGQKDSIVPNNPLSQKRQTRTPSSFLDWTNPKTKLLFSGKLLVSGSLSYSVS